jgi:geranylgeranyl diphosphate synthase, type II
MFSFSELSKEFNTKFSVTHFPNTPKNLYDPCNYFLGIGGKRVRPVLCLMGCNLFGEINPDAWHVANAVELFHNFTLIHDDMMDAASLRRGMQTVHTKFNNNIAILAGDVMMIQSIEVLNKIHHSYLQQILGLFNKTAREVCEGQQMDMDFETQEVVLLDEYIEMINLKTSVLLAASLQMGGILGGASEGNCLHLYEFGRNLGIAFQIQDDYLDAFGNPEKFGKEVGGDIKQNKKTFLFLHALEVATEQQKKQIEQLITENPANKVEQMLQIFKDCGVDVWANELKEKYFKIAMKHLDDIAVISARKTPLKELAEFLIVREN